MFADTLDSPAPGWLISMMSSSRVRSRDASADAPARAGADDAQVQLERLYRSAEVRLTNVVYRYLWDREDTRDVVQEAFMRLWHKRDQLDWSRAEALAFKVALDLARNRRRGRRLWRWVGLDRIGSVPDPATDPSHRLDAVTDEQSLRAAIDRLPERLRQVLVMCAFSDLSYEQIGAVLDVAPGTVASRRHDAIARIRRDLERPGPETAG